MIDYRFHAHEPGVFMEVYLPKKSELQGALYDTLTAGIYVENLRTHFRNADRKREIVKLLEEHYPEAADYSEEMIADFPERMYAGYSMYEVDGVFYNEETNNLAAERTQVIRFMFVYVDYERKHLPMLKAFFRSPLSTVVAFTDQTPLAGSKAEQAEQLSVLEKAEKWVDYIGLFMYGYVLLEICRRIEECYAKDSSTHVRQDQIWVGSFWNMSLNRIVAASKRKTS